MPFVLGDCNLQTLRLLGYNCFTFIYKMLFMRRLAVFSCLFFMGIGVFAQLNLSPVSITPKKQATHSDSMKSKGGAPAQQHKKMILALDTLTMSDYTLSIERVNDNLNAIGDSAKLGFEVVKIARRIDFMTSNIKLIRQNIRDRNTVFNIKNQYLYQTFTAKLDEETDQIHDQLGNLYQRVYHAKHHLKGVLADSIFRKLYADKELRTTFDKKLIRLEWKWNRTDSLTKANVDTLNAMKVRLSDNSITLSNMLNMLNNRLDKAGPKLLGPEVSHLWETGREKAAGSEPLKNPISIMDSEQKAVGYYITQTSGERTLVVVFGILLFTWLFLKRKLITTLRHNNTYSYLNLHYLNNFPVLSLVVLLLCLMPFFDAYAPTSYISIEYFLLLVASSIILQSKVDRLFLINWYALAALFIADVLAYFLIEPTLGERLLLLAIHAGIVLFTVRLYRTLRKETPYVAFIKSALVIGIILAGAGILVNIFGRFSLSGMVGIASIFAVTQAVVLILFVEVILEIILIQLLSSRLKKGIDKPFDSSIVIDKIKMPLILIAVLIWLIMFTSNLNIYHTLSNEVVEVLTRTRTLGSISFQLLSVILFFVIIWFAHILQRLLSFLFGEIGMEAEDLTTETKGQHSRLLITRLLVLIGGYLIAIAASGLPIDKLTFLLGALGVGIGMGLQSIVNNFVSGIILIFDGSLQIGDEIEVAGQAGKVKEIGLRSSTLHTPDGAEVIIPNGNILAQNIVNWTFSNNERRVVLTFSLKGNELDANIINEIINGTIKNIPNVVSKRKPVILYTKVTPETCSLTIRFWSIISNADQVKSEAMLRLSAAFHTREIGFE